MRNLNCAIKNAAAEAVEEPDSAGPRAEHQFKINKCVSVDVREAQSNFCLIWLVERV